MDYSWSYFAVVAIGVFIYSLVRLCKWLWKYFKSPVLVWYARVRAWCVRTRVRARALVITLLEDMQRTERQRQHEIVRRHTGPSLLLLCYPITTNTVRRESTWIRDNSSAAERTSLNYRRIRIGGISAGYHFKFTEVAA